MTRCERRSGQRVLRCSIAFAVVFVIDLGSGGALDDVCRLYGPCPPAQAPSDALAPLRIELIDPAPDLTPVPGSVPESPPSGGAPSGSRSGGPETPPDGVSMAGSASYPDHSMTLRRRLIHI